MRRFSVLLTLLLASALAYAAPARVYSVKLTWIASTSSTVTQYRVYRGTSSGGETVLTTVGNVLTYTDSPISVGTTYYYQVSAINANAQEGPRSTEISVQVARVTLSGNVVLGGNIGVVFSPITPPSSACSAPTYNCARTDLAAAPAPPAPNVGNVTGKGICFNDPDFGSKVCRITDSTINGNTLVIGEGSSGDSVEWNKDSTKVVVGSVGGTDLPLNFNPTTMATSRMYTNWSLLPTIAWSYVNKDLLYQMPPTGTPRWVKYDTSSPTIPSAVTAMDVQTCLNTAIGGTFTQTWNTDGGISNDDTTFSGGFSNNGGQGGPGALYVAYAQGTNCQVLNTATGAISSVGVWPSGFAQGSSAGWHAITDPDGFTIHNVKQAKNGGYIVVSPTTGIAINGMTVNGTFGIGATTISINRGASCGTPNPWVTTAATRIWIIGDPTSYSITTPVSIGCSSNVSVNISPALVQAAVGGTSVKRIDGACSGCAVNVYVWQRGTLNVTTSNVNLGGHFGTGNSHLINNNSTGSFKSRLFSALNSPVSVFGAGQVPVGLVPIMDGHLGWANVDAGDTNPFCWTNYTTNIPVPNVAWYNEVLCTSPVNGTTFRFAHTFITARSQRFNDLAVIGAVSQDGRFMAWSSDWMGTLGSESGASTCTIGVDCRGDVFVVDLNTIH